MISLNFDDKFPISIKISENWLINVMNSSEFNDSFKNKISTVLELIPINFKLASFDVINI